MSESTRDKLVAISIQTMMVKGFNNTGIAEILAEAKVPKGSFYHYFKSKDDLGLAIINHYGQQLRADLVSYLAASEGTSLARLRSYFENVLKYFETNLGMCNCLLGNLGQELATQNVQMREAIFYHYRAVEGVMSDSLRQAKQEGELAAQLDEKMLAEMFFAGWQGSLIRAKLEQSAQPMRDLINLYFTVIFKGV